MEALLNPSIPFDVTLLDNIMRVFNDPRHAARGEADEILVRFRSDPESWTKVDTILSTSLENSTKYYALQILEDVIRYRWRALPLEQREGIRTYIIQKILLLSSDEGIMRSESLLIKKMDLLLVQVLKHEWPVNWPTFISDLVESSKTSEVLCENNVHILRLLSEEAFDYSKYTMTHSRAEAMKGSLAAEFSRIFELLLFILQNSTRPSLVVATLGCLQRYITWIPQQYVFETPVLELVCMRYLPEPAFRVPALEVLTEVVALDNAEYNETFVLLYQGTMSQIVSVVPPDLNIRAAYEAAEREGNEDMALFIRHLALFLAAFFRAHAELLETAESRDALLSGMNYLVGISDIEETELFKVCVEFWLSLASDLYAVEVAYDPRLALVTNADGELVAPAAPLPPALPALPAAAGALMAYGGVGGGGGGGMMERPVNVRKLLYREVLARVRELMIRHFAKPEEVLIEKDEAGEFVREMQKDTDVIALYKVMKDTMVFLTHLDPKNTEDLMLEKLTRVMDPAEWSNDALNTLCWAIGSVSGTMSEGVEKHFLVTVIKDLLLLCETKKGKSSKAVVASNIMYVVGQYPRFLRAHWKFLRTVVLKLFEFMHEKHPGVQDMAVDTFLKIAEKCKKKFVMVQLGEAVPFIEELCSMLPTVINDLEPHQIHTFYEAVGHMVAAASDATTREYLVGRLMALPNSMWTRLMHAAAESLDNLRSPDMLHEVQRVLRTNVAACTAVGPAFSEQLGRLFLDMLNVYRVVSSFLGAAVAAGGPAMMHGMESRCMTAVRKEVLRLISTYVKRTDDPRSVQEHFMPHLLPVLDDYATALPATREPDVLVLMTEIVDRLQLEALADAPRILGAVFESTLGMMGTSSTEYPEHRLGFFKLVEAINRYCFPALFGLEAEQQRAVVDGILSAVRHETREIGETGLAILQTMLDNVAAAGGEGAQAFYAAHYLTLVQEVLTVLTDRVHKAHFKEQVAVLNTLAAAVEYGYAAAPLWTCPTAIATGTAAAFEARSREAGAAAGGVIPPDLLTNQVFVRDFVRAFIASTFTNLLPTQVTAFVEGVFNMGLDAKAYKAHVRDFLIEVLEFKAEGDEGAELYGEERAAAADTAARSDAERRRAVPGLANPYEVLAADYVAVDYNDL